ncbi:RagB/SusD family nutrient uptake outer membrane protein [Chitinophaga lutea]
MMKKQFLAILGICAAFVSCSKFLDEVPEDRLATENFYKNAEDARSAVNAVYNPLRSGVFRGPYFLQTEIMADYAEGRGSTSIIGEYKGLDVVNIARVATLWDGFYRTVRNANIAIENIPGITSMGEADKKALIAEARFLRAFAYYHLVRHWGKVPLYLSTQTASSPRQPEADVYAAIIADLQDAEANLPPKGAQNGRPGYWAAKALLAEVYLTTGAFDKARDKADEVIASGAFGLINITKASDWNNVFGPTVNGTSEEVFYLKFSQLDGWEWPHNLLYSETTFSPFGNYVIFSTLDNKFLNAWDPQDNRKQWDVFTEYISRITGLLQKLPVSTPVQFSKWRDPSAPTLTGHSNDYPFLRYADVLLIYAEAAAMAENGPSAKAVEQLNKIHRRAYGYPSGAPSPVDFPTAGWTQETFRDAVLQERAYELFMEGKRWLDLKRTGKIKSVIKANKGKDVQDVHLYWPIPQQEIDTNPDITQADQNPGY